MKTKQVRVAGPVSMAEVSIAIRWRWENTNGKGYFTSANMGCTAYADVDENGELKMLMVEGGEAFLRWYRESYVEEAKAFVEAHTSDGSCRPPRDVDNPREVLDAIKAKFGRKAAAA